MSEIYNFTDYAYSKHVVDDYPHILALYQKLIPALVPFQAYAGVWVVLVAVQESLALMERELKQSKRIYHNKGKLQVE